MNRIKSTNVNHSVINHCLGMFLRSDNNGGYIMEIADAIASIHPVKLNFPNSNQENH